MYKYEIIAQDKQYDASRITIREAMEHLVHNGLITKRRGSGTFVKAISGGALNQEGFARSQQFGGFAKDKPGHEITSVIHEFQPLKASAKIADLLQIPEGGKRFYLFLYRKYPETEDTERPPHCPSLHAHRQREGLAGHRGRPYSHSGSGAGGLFGRRPNL